MSCIIGKYKISAITFCLLSFCLLGCARHHIGYDISPEEPIERRKEIIAITLFSDERPEQEHKGATDELFTFSSKDSHFEKEVDVSICEQLKKELDSVGIRSFFVEQPSGTDKFDYILKGKILHFQTLMKPSKSTIIPYLGAVSSIWAKDRFLTMVTIEAQFYDTEGNLVFDEVFDISDDLKLKTGFLNISRYKRGLNHKLAILDNALADVLTQIRKKILSTMVEKKIEDFCFRIGNGGAILTALINIHADKLQKQEFVIRYRTRDY